MQNRSLSTRVRVEALIRQLEEHLPRYRSNAEVAKTNPMHFRSIWSYTSNITPQYIAEYYAKILSDLETTIANLKNDLQNSTYADDVYRKVVIKIYNDEKNEGSYRILEVEKVYFKDINDPSDRYWVVESNHGDGWMVCDDTAHPSDLPAIWKRATSRVLVGQVGDLHFA